MSRFVVSDDHIKEDFKWLKNELRGLTKEERGIIVKEYLEKVGAYGIGVKEYQAFMRMFEELEEG